MSLNPLSPQSNSQTSLGRRSFLGAAASGAAALAANMNGLDLLQNPLFAAELKRQDKRVILLWLAGGASQLETWDPKPGRPTGGPFRAIQTSTPGIQISELLPKMSQHLERTSIIRSLNTKIGDHGGASRLMLLGRRDEPNLTYPDLGAMLSKELGHPNSRVPDYVNFYTATEGRRNASGQSGFLGARYQPMFLTTDPIPKNLKRLGAISQQDHKGRAELRDRLSRRFVQGRIAGALGSHNEAFARIDGLMQCEKLFDIEQEPQTVRDRYGPSLFAKQTLVARRLIDAGVPFVKISRAWWDSHGQNFETHLELVSELDHVMSTLLDDLKERGMLDNTLVITLSEFGRTPNINASLGRDHFARAWSATLSGCGVKGGMAYGKTDEDGQHVADGEVGSGELFATIFQALGIDHEKEYHVGARPIPLTNPGIEPIREVLA